MTYDAVLEAAAARAKTLSNREETFRDDPRFDRAFQLADSGSDGSAAQVARSLLEEGAYDVRLIRILLFAEFSERGPAAMGELLNAWTKVFGEHFDVLGPARDRPKRALSELNRFARDVMQRMQGHRQRETETWSGWRRELEFEPLAAIEGQATALRNQVNTALSSLEGEDRLGPLLRFVDEVLIPMVRARKSSRSKQPNETAPSPAPKRQEPRPVPVNGNDTDSPAMKLLKKRLHAFQVLVKRNDMAKAAIVAQDIRHTLENFDAVLYLPHLFAGYFALLHEVGDQIVRYAEMEDSYSHHALEQLYRADLEAFLGERSESPQQDP